MTATAYWKSDVTSENCSGGGFNKSLEDNRQFDWGFDTVEKQTWIKKW